MSYPPAQSAVDLPIVYTLSSTYTAVNLALYGASSAPCTIPSERVVHPQMWIQRSTGNWNDVTDYLSYADINCGDVTGIGTDGGDGVPAEMSFALRNERIHIGTTSCTGASFSPRDQGSTWNLGSTGGYDPLLAANADVVFRVAIESYPEQSTGTTMILLESLGVGDGSTACAFSLNWGPVVVSTSSTDLLKGTVYIDEVETTSYVANSTAIPATVTLAAATSQSVVASYCYYRTMFHGLLGRKIHTAGPTVECQAVDPAKRLQYSFVKSSCEYGNSTGQLVEETIQAIIDDWVETNAPTLETPVSPGFAVLPHTFDGYESVWDALQWSASHFGGWVGYAWSSSDNDFHLKLLDPGRDKDADTADWSFTGVNDIWTEDLDVSDDSIRNDITVQYYSTVDNTLHSVNVVSTASIDIYERRPMVIGEQKTSLIGTSSEAEAMGNYALSDLGDMTMNTLINLPLFPSLQVFDGINVDNALVASEPEFFGANALRHTLDFEGHQYRTEVGGGAHVTGGKQRWLQIQARPGTGARPVVTGGIDAAAVRTREVAADSITTALLASGAASMYQVYALGDETGFTTTSTSYVDITNYQIVFELDGAATVLAIMTLSGAVNSDGVSQYFNRYCLNVDSTDITDQERRLATQGTDWGYGSVAISYMTVLSSGSHTIKGRTRIGSAGGVSQVTDRELNILVLNKAQVLSS